MLIGRTKKWRAIQYSAHLKGNGASVFAHVCRLGLGGVVSKRQDAPYRSGPSKTWLKSKNPASEAVRREPRRSGANVPGYVHQTENTIQAIRAMLRTKAVVLTTSLLRARFAMGHFWRQSCDSFDLDQASFREVRRPLRHETVRRTETRG
jgi:hypothetical protein